MSEHIPSRDRFWRVNGPLSKRGPQLLTQFAPGPRMIFDLLPCLFGIEAAAERALVPFLKVERQFLHNLCLACVGDSQRRKILAHIGSEIRHVRGLRPVAAPSQRRSTSGAAPTTSFGLGA